MFELELGEVLDAMESEGSVSGSEWEPGQYNLEIVRTNYGMTKSGSKPKLGLLWRATDGPYAGESEWENITYDKDNKTSREIFVNKMLSLGVSKEFLRTKPTMEQIASMLEGICAVVEFSKKPWKSDSTKIEKRFKIIRLIDTDLDSTESDSDDDVFGGLGE